MYKRQGTAHAAGDLDHLAHALHHAVALTADVGGNHPVVAPLYAMKKSLDWEVDKFQGCLLYTSLEGHCATVLACVQEMKPYLIGKDPMRIEDFSTVLYRCLLYTSCEQSFRPWRCRYGYDGWGYR